MMGFVRRKRGTNGDTERYSCSFYIFLFFLSGTSKGGRRRRNRRKKKRRCTSKIKKIYIKKEGKKKRCYFLVFNVPGHRVISG